MKWWTLSKQILRVIFDPPAVGAWNMAVDQALLQSVEESGMPVVRIYGWQPATLSLGYFQSYVDRESHSESLPCSVVRRASGGGAILHDQETTYSLCIPSSNRWAKQNTEVYNTVHECISESLSDWDVEVAAFEEPQAKPERGNGSPFLCFQRRYPGDLIFKGQKVVGSAQRRSKTALLQHGSILWDRSLYAPQLAGINDLAEQTIDTLQFAEAFVTRLSAQLEIPMQRHEMVDSVRAMAGKIMDEKFDKESWTKSRNRDAV